MMNKQIKKINQSNNMKITYLMREKNIRLSSYPIKFLILELIIDVKLSSC
jgi:hypothetical protein